MKNRICIVGPAWVGDMVMAQCLFKTIMQDDATVIDVLAPHWTLPLLDRMPEVRYGHALPIGHGSLQLIKRHRIAKALRSYAYTQSIVLPNSWKSALIPWWAKIPKRTGFLGECRFGLLNDIRVLDEKRMPRMIDRFVALGIGRNSDLNSNPNRVSAIPYPCLRADASLVERAIEKFSIRPLLDRPILALCPGAEFGSSKRWPARYYAEIALKKHQEGWSVWIFGSKNDSETAARIQAEIDAPLLDLTGKTDLGEAVDLLSLVSMAVSNDSGLMHIVAALQKPLVALYGSTDPAFTPPLGENAEIVRLGLPCSPCFERECPLGHHRCMRALMPETVLSAMDKMAVEAVCAY